MKDFKIMLYKTSSIDVKKWNEIKNNWIKEYKKYETDDYELSIPSSFQIFQEIIITQADNIQIFSLDDKEGKSQALFQGNIASIPKYDSPVLRIRHIIFSPIWDFEIKNVDEHSKLWGELFSEIANLAINKQIKHIKIHMNSPYEAKMLFANVAKSLEKQGIFSNVRDYGAWVDFSIK